MEHEDDYVLFEKDGTTWARFGDASCERMDGHDGTYVLIPVDDEASVFTAVLADRSYARWSFQAETESGDIRTSFSQT